MNRALFLSVGLSAGLICLSCGGNGGSTTPRVASRAFVSQDISGGNVIAGIQVIDADKDRRVFQGPITAGATPGLMVVTPNRRQTLVFSAAGNNVALLTNADETVGANVALPGATESIVVSPDSQTAYVAVPAAPVVAQSPGEIEVINLNNGTIRARISCPPGVRPGPADPVCADAAGNGVTFNLQYRYLAIGNSGNRLLAFSENSNTVAVVTPANIATDQTTITFIDGFDRPVAGFFSPDDNTAFIVNCGPECGGTQASVQRLDLTSGVPVAGAPSPVAAATVALISGSTMYLAGTPLGSSQGQLTVFDLTTMTVVPTDPSPLVITDGYHTRMALAANNRLYIGARDCTEVSGVSGCLSIYDTQTNAITIPSTNGDVTALQPIPRRTVVYVVQGGELRIYDTATDALIEEDKQIDISGEAVDVKTVDF